PVTPGDYTVEVFAPGSDTLSDVTLFRAGVLTLTADTQETLVLPNRVLTGTVVDADGHPVPGVSVQGDFSVAFGNFTGGLSASTTTDTMGNFRLVLLPGSGTILALPPPASLLVGTTVSATITVDTTITITLPRPVIYSGAVVDRDGMGV